MGDNISKLSNAAISSSLIANLHFRIKRFGEFIAEKLGRKKKNFVEIHANRNPVKKEKLNYTNSGLLRQLYQPHEDKFLLKIKQFALEGGKVIVLSRSDTLSFKNVENKLSDFF